VCPAVGAIAHHQDIPHAQALVQQVFTQDDVITHVLVTTAARFAVRVAGVEGESLLSDVTSGFYRLKI